MRIGYFLSCEEYAPADLIAQAAAAQEAGFDALWISDHFHPWNETQGEAPFVWSMIGAISQVCDLPITTAVTCPTVRVHPAIVAQAAATSAVLTGGKFILGLGSGEALNEHILGQRWPDVGVRLAMLEESIEVMRSMWAGGFVDHHGPYYTVENAKLYTLPDDPIPVYLSGFGPKAAALAGRIGDGFVTTSPEQKMIDAFREAGGAGKPMQAGYKVAWGRDEAAAIEVAHRTWANEGLPGELAQILPSPIHFEQASQLVSKDAIAEAITCGADVTRHVDAFAPYAKAGFDEVYIQQVGGREDATNSAGFFEFYQEKILPELREAR